MVLKIEGIIPAVTTPFKPDETLDEEAVGVLIDHLIEGGVHGIFTAGSVGEFWALSTEEKKKLFQMTVEKVNGRVPVYVGTGAESTREAIELTKSAEDVGVDAVTIITPYYIKPNAEELIHHFRIIAEKVDLPVIVYNNPARTGGVNIDPEVVLTLAEECSNILGVKDSSGDVTLSAEYLRRCGKRVSVLVGRDTLIYAGLVQGASGAVTSCGNVVPKRVVQIFDALSRGDHKKALKAQYELFPFRLAFSLGTFPTVVKEALNIVGLPGGNCRAPILPLTAENRKKLMVILSEMGIIKR